jgi:Na+/H+-dicarboxylate symporter
MNPAKPIAESTDAAPPQTNALFRSFAAVGWVLGAAIGGGLLGLVGGEWVTSLLPISKLVIQLIKAAATPLVFFAVIEAVLRHQVRGRDFASLLLVVSVNACVAISIGLLMARLFQPGQHLKFLEQPQATSLAKPDLATLLQKQVPSSVLEPLVDNDILGIVAIGLAMAFAVRIVRERVPEFAALPTVTWVSFAREVSELVLTWVVKLVPLAVFAAAANITQQHGLAPLRGLAQYVGLCALGMFAHMAVTYSLWLWGVARVRVVTFYREALQPAVYAFGVNSSLVALPLTLRALDRLGISRRASTLTACVGTNLNNDGIILYEGFTLLAIAQAVGLDLSFGAQLAAALYCVVAAMGVAGVPEAGVVALTLVFSAFGLPVEMLAALLSVDWLVARFRSVLNLVSDMVGATVLERWLLRD